MLFNLFIYYKTTIAYIFWLKYLFIYNNNKLPIINTLLVYFVLKNLEWGESSKIFNYIYLLRFFFGLNANIYNYAVVHSFGRFYSNFDLFVLLRKQPAIFSCLYVYVYEIQPLLDLSSSRTYLITNSTFRLSILDMSIFSEKKTNLGLFFLEDRLNLLLNYTFGENIYLATRLINALKILL